MWIFRDEFRRFCPGSLSLTRKLTIDLGVRYDFEHLPAGFNQDTNTSARELLSLESVLKWVFRAGTEYSSTDMFWPT